MEDWKELEFTLNTLRSQPTLKYRKCRKILDTTVDRLRAVSILKTNTVLATAALVNPIVASIEVAQRQGAMAKGVSSSIEERLFGQVVMQQQFNERATDEMCMAVGVKSQCFNCRGIGHLQRDCPVLYCKFCNKTWSTKAAPGYHFFSDCTAGRSTEPLVSDSFVEQVPQQVRADSRGGGRGSFRGVYGRGYVRSGGRVLSRGRGENIYTRSAPYETRSGYRQQTGMPGMNSSYKGQRNVPFRPQGNQVILNNQMGMFIPMDELPMETGNGLDLESSMALLPATESYVSNDGYDYVVDNIDGDGLGEGNGYST
jgi:hypothetical protein